MNSSRPNDFIRKHIRADYKPGDHVLGFGDTPPASERPGWYLKRRKVGRWADMVWYVISVLLGLFLMIVTLLGLFTEPKVWNAEWWQPLLVFGMFIVGGVIFLTSQSYLRWMFRHRNAPRQE